MSRSLLRLVLLLFFISGKLSAQHLTVSPESIEDPGFEHVKIIGQDENGFYLLQSNLSLQIQRDRVGFKNRKYKLSYFNYNLQLKWAKKLEEVNEQRNIDLVAMFNGTPLIITSEWHRAENNISYFAETINSLGNSEIKNKSLGSIVYTKGSDVEKSRLVISHDDQHAVLSVNEFRDNDQVLHLLVADTGVNVNAHYDLVINYDVKQFEISEMAVSNNNDIAAIGLNTEKNVGQKGKIASYKLLLLRAGESVFDVATVASGDKNITEAALTFDNINDKVVITGFYYDGDSYTGTGILFASMPLKTKEPLEIKSVSIDDNTRIKMIGERNSGANTGLHSYPIKKMILRSDGGAVVIAESAYYSEYSYYDYFTQSFTRKTEYHYDNVVIMSIHTNGTIDWSGVLRKSQETSDDGGFLSSFCTVLENERIDLVYNDDIGRNNEVALYTISNKGVANEKKISKPGDHITIIPNSADQVDENTLIAAAILKKRLYLVKIEL